MLILYYGNMIIWWYDSAKKLTSAQPKGTRGTSAWSSGNISLTNSMLHARTWSSHLWRAAGSDTRPSSDMFYNDNEYCRAKSGGDLVLASIKTNQKLHADVAVRNKFDVRLPPPLLCIKFAVQPLTAHNGPTRIDSCTMRLVISGKHTSVTITTTSFVAHVAHLGEPDLTLDDAKRS